MKMALLHGLSRRGFLQRIGAAAVALTLARHLPGIAGRPEPLGEPPSVEIAFQKGDIITFEGRYAINPITQRSTGHLQQYQVIETVAVGEPVTVHPSLSGMVDCSLAKPIGMWA